MRTHPIRFVKSPIYQLYHCDGTGGDIPNNQFIRKGRDNPSHDWSDTFLTTCLSISIVLFYTRFNKPFKVSVGDIR